MHLILKFYSLPNIPPKRGLLLLTEAVACCVKQRSVEIRMVKKSEWLKIVLFTMLLSGYLDITLSGWNKIYGQPLFSSAGLCLRPAASREFF